MSERVRKPEWLKISIGANERYTETKRIVESHCLHTICSSGRCPNMGECWGKGTATFMIGGDICTRCCKFCNTQTGKPMPLDLQEPVHVAESIALMKLSHAVVTSVDRDDLPDLGAAHWVQTIREIKRLNPDTTVEVLIPDFQGRKELIDMVIEARPEIISHNMETVKRISPLVRSAAHYETSLEVLRQISESGTVAKSGIMVGLGETPDEVAALMDDLRAHLSGVCVDFTDPDPEQIALCDEAALEQYLDTGALPDETVRALIRGRKLFPCLFGSGLKLTGVDELLAALVRYAVPPDYPSEFGARVYKIMRDAQGNRLTCLKVTGGQLRVRTPLTYLPRGADTPVQEKVNAIRLYSGEKFESAETVPAGGVCAVQGLTQTYPGQGLGSAAASMPPSLEPVLTYRIGLPPDVDARAFLPRLRELEEEDPQLHIVWDEALREIHVQLMGTVQIEVLKSLIRERFDVDVQVDSGRILYQETIAAPVEGVGHFEPLRHYAEVHLLLEPAERGTGLTFDTSCSEDVLDRNWQRLILTHLAEKCHRGVLTGAPLTDVKITLLAGRAHIKHTEGGDFRQATWRAVRQGLMQAESVLLEPYYAFRIEVPAEQIGRAISDVRLMCGTFSSPETHGDMAVLTGRAPVSTMRDYPAEVAAYTRGRGRISCTVAGYDTCHNAQEVIAESGYEPTRDLDNTPDSVFCAHGAGTVIPWDRVRDYMHLDTGFGKEQPTPEDTPRMFRRRFDLDDRELEQILQREFGPIRRAQYAAPVRNAAPGADETERAELFHPRRERVIVDGYNVIFAWDELRALADSGHIDAARERLMDALSNYAAFTRREVVVVFDGYRVPGGQGEKFDRSGLHVVFTRQGETADAYMEKLADEIGKNDSVRVVTSDALIQLTALRAGVLRMSAREFRQELAQVAQQLEAAIRDLNGR